MADEQSQIIPPSEEAVFRTHSG